jgi:hypothetical protein
MILQPVASGIQNAPRQARKIASGGILAKNLSPDNSTADNSGNSSGPFTQCHPKP